MGQSVAGRSRSAHGCTRSRRLLNTSVRLHGDQISAERSIRFHYCKLQSSTVHMPWTGEPPPRGSITAPLHTGSQQPTTVKSVHDRQPTEGGRKMSSRPTASRQVQAPDAPLAEPNRPRPIPQAKRPWTSISPAAPSPRHRKKGQRCRSRPGPGAARKTSSPRDDP